LRKNSERANLEFRFGIDCDESNGLLIASANRLTRVDPLAPYSIYLELTSIKDMLYHT
jgi:hypothetical protein